MQLLVFYKVCTKLAFVVNGECKKNQFLQIKILNIEEIHNLFEWLLINDISKQQNLGLETQTNVNFVKMDAF